MALFHIVLFLKPFIYERIFIHAHHCWHILLLAYLVWFVAKKKYSQAVDPFFQTLLLLFELSTILSFSYAVFILRNQYFDSQHLYSICAGIFFCMLAFYGGERAVSLIKILLISSIGICLLALYTLFPGTPAILTYFRIQNLHYPFTEEFLSRHRAFFPFVSPDILGGFLILCFFLCLSFLQRKSLYLLLLLLICGTLILTKSIGIYGALLSGLCAYLYAQRERYSKQTRLRALIGGLVILSIFFILRQQFENPHNTPVFSLQKRVDYISHGIKMILRHPFSGWGLGQFYPISGTKYTHNLWIQLWAEAGLPSLLIFCTFIGLTFKRGWQNIQSSLNPDDKRFHAALFSAHTAFVIHNCVDFDFFIFQASFVWWILVGWIHYAYFNRTKKLSACSKTP